MTRKVLLTSFQTWLPHQRSNSSDDLLAILQREANSPTPLTFLRQLPVDIDRASQRAIAAIATQQPHAVICCGMAESRQHLTLESRATDGKAQLETSVNLASLVAKLSHTQISHDAGKFVCEGLYYRVLNYLQQFQPHTDCLFVHVPVLNTDNFSAILSDFRSILSEIGLNTAYKAKI